MNLDEAAVEGLLRMEEVIPAMERALSDFSSGKVVQPVRTMLPVAEHQGFLGLMPAYTGAALGTKLVAFYPHNTGVPTHHATILLFKPETGEPLVTMDGRLITEVRTAAVSAVATEHLARSDTSVLAIIGSGVQARSHLEALRMVREFRERRDLIVEGLNRIPGVSCQVPAGAFYAFPNVTSFGAPATEVAGHLLEEGGVACLGGTAFGPHGEGYVRLSYVNSVQNIRDALEAAEAALAGFPG
jgi:hypothetical protein